MHTVKVVGTGFGLLALCAFVGRVADGRQGMATGATVFLPLWLAGTGLNMFHGVKHAGYEIGQELPVAAGVFAVPALAALGLRSRLR